MTTCRFQHISEAISKKIFHPQVFVSDSALVLFLSVLSDNLTDSR